MEKPVQEHLRPVPASGEDSQTKVRARQRPRANKALPTDRMKFDSAVLALKAIVLESGNGSEAVGALEIARRLGISPATASLNNAFFTEAGFITRETKGRWKPASAAIEFARQHSFDPERAGLALAEPFKRSWYFREVKQQLGMGPATVDRMIEVLARAAGATAEHRPHLGLVLEWLEYTGLIDTEGGQVTMTSPQPVEPQPEVVKPPADPQSQRPTTDTDSQRQSQGEAVLIFSFDFCLTAADLAVLSPEQIRAVFDAVGQVAAIKATIRRE